MWNISFSQGSQKFLSLLSTPESVIKTWNLHHPIAAQVLHCFEYWCLRGIKLNASISFFCFKESSSQLIDGWHYFLSSYLSLRVKLLVFIYIKYLSIISGFKQILFFFKIIVFICLFLTVLGLACCAGFSPAWVNGATPCLQCVGFSPWWFLLWHRLQGAWGFSSCHTRAPQVPLPSFSTQAQ